MEIKTVSMPEPETTGTGPLFIIGGHEDKEGDRDILKAIARELGGGKLVLCTVASHEPDGYLEMYRQAFADLDVGEIVELYVDERTESSHSRVAEKCHDAAGIFFTGGDQLRISSHMGCTPVEDEVRRAFERGAVIAGTSAGASVMSETMLVNGAGGSSFRIGDLHMAPGLGLLRDVLIDQHFAERGRHGRLLGAVAHNPRLLGLGIDENTAAVVRGNALQVLGQGAVTVIDGSGISHTNIAEGQASDTLSAFGVKVHVLAEGNGFDLNSRQPRVE